MLQELIAERRSQLEILTKVLGKCITEKKKRKIEKPRPFTRYDPYNAEHVASMLKHATVSLQYFIYSFHVRGCLDVYGSRVTDIPICLFLQPALRLNTIH